MSPHGPQTTFYRLIADGKLPADTIEQVRAALAGNDDKLKAALAAKLGGATADDLYRHGAHACLTHWLASVT
jgi:hypothetical protein